MLDAAHELFATRGYTGTRMTDVAAAAGVAVQTVYFTFHTKPELLRACYTRAVLGAENLPPLEQAWHRAMLAATSAPGAVREFVLGNTAICARVGLLDDVVRSAAHEPDAVAVRARSEELRRAGYRETVAHLDGRFGLRDGLDVDRATDVLLALGGPALYRSLVVDYGWSEGEFADWLARTVTRELFG
jgi:AcrR family transcriptional regulator